MKILLIVAKSPKKVLFHMKTRVSLKYFVTDCRCYSGVVYVNSFFPCRARLSNFLPIECFPLSYHLVAFSLELTDIF